MSTSSSELIYSGSAFAVKVTELDFQKSAVQLELEGGSGSPDNGSMFFGPYATEQEADADAVRASTYFEERARNYAAQYGEGELGWRVEVEPWLVPKHQTFSAWIAEEEARSRGILPEQVDLRALFSEPIEIKPGVPSRPSGLAERATLPE